MNLIAQKVLGEESTSLCVPLHCPVKNVLTGLCTSLLGPGTSFKAIQSNRMRGPDFRYVRLHCALVERTIEQLFNSQLLSGLCSDLRH
jgi:hypothetical protein